MAGFCSKKKFLYLVFNVALRFGLIYFGTIMDEASESVKFTDTDYSVFSDAAKHVAGSGSPYAR